MTHMTDTSDLGPLDRTRPEPLWHQVAEALRARISDGRWRPGSQIPPEDVLCETFGVSRITVRHAVQRLETEGLLRRDQGRGTFVRDARLVAGATGLTSFTQEIHRLGFKPGSRLLGSSVEEATGEVAQALDLEPGAKVHRIRRLRLGDDAPMGVQTAYIRMDRAPDLELTPDDESLYGVLRARHGISPSEAAEVYRVDRATEGDAELLEIDPGSPVFVVERTTVDEHGPFEFTVSTMRGDRYEIRSVLRSF
jgi:GntR family transcriptional regulator